jgi:hypothetical protein
LSVEAKDVIDAIVGGRDAESARGPDIPTQLVSTQGLNCRVAESGMGVARRDA